MNTDDLTVHIFLLMPLQFPGLSYRGSSTESARNINFDEKKNYFRSDTNEGNFVGLVKLMAGENVALAEHLKLCEQHAQSGRRNYLTFLSKNFVHKTLCIIQDYLLGAIVKEIRNAGGCFGVLMDGSQDVSCKEQVSIVVRYVDKSNNIVERTIGFFNAEDTSGKGLYESLRSKLSNVGLLLSRIIGCSFDGAPNMRSAGKGVQARIQRENPYCIYTWCMSHRFNLAMKSGTGSSEKVKEILQHVEETAKLFRSSHVRMNVWVDVVKNTPGINSQKRLKIIGTTRWSSKQDAVAAIIGNETCLYVLIKSLLKVCSLPNSDSSLLILASNILKFWLQYEIVLTTFILHNIFSLLLPTTKYLQTNGQNIVDGIKSLKKCISQLEASLEMLDQYIEEGRTFIEHVNSLLNKDLDITSLESDCKIIFPEAGEHETYIHNKIKLEFTKFIQHLQDEIDIKIIQDFNISDSIFHEMMYLDLQYVADNESFISFKKLCEINNIGDETAAVKEMKSLISNFINCSKYESIFNNIEYSVGPEEDEEEEIRLLIENEIDLNETTAMSNGNVKLIPMGSKICHCLQCILYFFNQDDRMNKYENIYKLYKYVATLPSTQVKCERDFSKMKIIKSRLRSTLTDESLESLMIISTESDMFQNIDLENILDKVIESSDKITLYMSKN